LGNNYPYRPEDRGFDEVLTYFASYSPRTPDQFRLRHNGHWKSFTGFRGKPWFDHAVSFIENNASHPFLLYLATSMVHAPNLGPEDLYDKYRKKLQAAGQMEAALEEKSRQLNGKYEGDRLVEMANRYVSMTIHLYAEIDFIDQGVGRILKTLERGNLRENTIVVFCSDGSGSKAFSFHVRPDDRSRPQNTEYAHPCLIDWPAAGWRKGLRVLERTANFDILPTLLDLCGAKPTADVKLDGQSFRSLLEEDPRGWSGRYFIMDDTSHYSPVSGWPVIRLMPLFETSVLSPNGGFASWRNGELVEQAGLSPKELVQAKAHFLDFWTQAMYEYEPYKYFIAGTRHENPMVIPNHYWVPVPDPHSTGPHPVRYCWPIEFTRDGSYAIEFWRIEDTSYVPEKAPTVYPGAHTGRLRIGRRQFDWKASEDGGVPHFDIDVQSGRYLVDATINPETDPVPSQCLMVRWVER
jgi:hypothetical protein